MTELGIPQSGTRVLFEEISTFRVYVCLKSKFTVRAIIYVFP